MQLETISQDFQKARRVNATDTSFPSRIPTKTRPALGLESAGSATSQDVIRTRGPNGAISQNLILVMPYGTGSDNDTFNLRLYAWRLVSPPNNDPNLNVYVPLMLCELACTLSATVGVAGTPLVATERLVDTIVLTTGSTANVTIVSPTGDIPAHALIDFLGGPDLEFTFDVNSGTTGMNALVAFL